MPNRVIREGFLDSDKINSLSDSDQLLFIRLMLIVDDYGRTDARLNFIRSKCYPTTDRQMSDISKSITQLARKKLILLYTVADKQYIEIQDFNQRLRIMKSRYPAPTDGQLAAVCQTDDGLNLNTKQKGKEDETEKNVFLSVWNEFASNNGLSQIKTLSKSRLSKLNIRNFNLEIFENILKGIKESDFCRGKNNNGWRVDFDWIIENDTNYLKIIEGKYKSAIPETSQRMPCTL